MMARETEEDWKDRVRREAAEVVSRMIAEEAGRGKMLPEYPEKIVKLMKSGNAFICPFDSDPDSYAAVYKLGEYMEIRSVITKKEKRGRGNGFAITGRAIDRAQFINYGCHPIIALTNAESAGLFQKHGFRPKDKRTADPELWKPCINCIEYEKWPDCHCQLHVLDGWYHHQLHGEFRTTSFTVIGLDVDYENDLHQASELYCQIWQEPPWFEYDWKVDEVKQYFRSILQKKNGHVLLALVSGKIIGFVAGWEMSKREFQKKTGYQLLSKLPSGPIFYIAELACVLEFRRRGIGHSLIATLEIEKAGHILTHILRTNVKSDGTWLYRKIGFKESDYRDPNFPDRSYWIKC